jgi:DNA-binding HxlR family transcriptional regulator
VARGLDVIGDRWTLLIVRDLLLGPKRYKDLLAGLPGIGTNLLATRLREMTAAGIIEWTELPPPAGSSVYRLTDSGQALEPAVTAIGRFGARFLGEPRSDDVLLPRAYFVAIRSAFRPGRTERPETYEFHVDDLVFTVTAKPGGCSTREGAADDPDAVITTDVVTLNALLLEGLPAQAALADGRAEITGDPEALDRFTAMFALRPAASRH